MLSDHINKETVLTFQTGGRLLLRESRAFSALLSFSNKQPPAYSDFHVTWMNYHLKQVLIVETRDNMLSRRQTRKMPIRLQRCAGWIAPLMFTCNITRRLLMVRQARFLHLFFILNSHTAIVLKRVHNKCKSAELCKVLTFVSEQGQMSIGW